MLTLAICLLTVSLAFSILIKFVYVDVFGHWPSWQEIFDYHKTDEVEENE